MLPSLPPDAPPPSAQPPPKPPALVLLLQGLKLIIPLPFAAVVIGALVVAHLQPRVSAPALVVEHPPAVDEDFTSGSPMASFTSMVLPGRLPAPHPKQRRAPCDPDTQVEIDGVCWVQINVKKCSKGGGYEHKGACYLPFIVDRPSQSGDPRTAPLANPSGE